MVKAQGGWFARLSNDDMVDLRVPVGKLEAVQAFIESQGLEHARLDLGTHHHLAAGQRHRDVSESQLAVAHGNKVLAVNGFKER